MKHALWLVATVAVVGAVLALQVGPVHADAASYRITDLPGVPAGFNNSMYSGYVNVDAKSNRNLFFWFVESSAHPATDPVVLWLNGGPGCSSLGGLFSENGPFWPTANGNGLAVNTDSWVGAANMIWLESPAGVGFSYSNNHADYTTGDKQTAEDAYSFLQTFFREFPQFAANPFFVSGESYGGHYVPNLAARIVAGNAEGSGLHINLKGFLAGNPWTDAPVDNWGAVEYWFTHGLISNQSYEGIMAHCDFAHIGPLRAGPATPCDTALNQAQQEMQGIDIYEIYEDLCTTRPAQQLLQAFAHTQSALAVLARLPVRTAAASQDPTSPCIDGWVQSYLNRPDVQKAIHAQPTQWTDCSGVVNYSYTDLLTSVLPVYQSLFGRGLQILVYSGDVDAIVPFTGTRKWLSLLPMTQTAAMRPWSTNGQVGGWVTTYKELAFATVRGAGHLVPGTQPARSYWMFSRFIHGQPL